MAVMESLSVALEEQKARSAAKYPEDRKQAYQRGIDAVETSGIVSSAKQVGDLAPNFTLKNGLGNDVSLKDQLRNGPVILTWYRGGWCPYCNLALRYLQGSLSEFEALGANMIALTPELPDNSLSTVEKNHLDFEVLTDIDSEVAREYGLVFKLIPEVADIYQEAFDLAGYNGNDHAELPLAATYLIDQEGVIRWAFLDADYRNRAEPSDIIQALKLL